MLRHQAAYLIRQALAAHVDALVGVGEAVHLEATGGRGPEGEVRGC